jgi:hypothetical protein
MKNKELTELEKFWKMDKKEQELIEFENEYNLLGFAGCLFFIVEFVALAIFGGFCALIVELIKHGL